MQRPFARRIEGLQKVFPSSGREVGQPTALDDLVVPTYDFPPHVASLERVSAATTPSNNDVAPQLSIGPIASGFYLEELYGRISHNSVTDRVITVSINDPSGITQVFVARMMIRAIENAVGKPYVNVGGMVDPASSIYYAPIRLIVPAGFTLVFQGDVAAAAYTMSISRISVQHPLAEGMILR